MSTEDEPGREVPDDLATVLRALDGLQDELGSAHFCEGFELLGDRAAVELAEYCADDAFVGRLVPFAFATFGGSLYARWHADDGGCPIVVLGDEGGFHPVAVDLASFLQLLSLDVEPEIDADGVDYWPDDDENSDSHERYRTWILDCYGLDAIDAPRADEIVDEAGRRYGEAFRSWAASYLDPPA